MNKIPPNWRTDIFENIAYIGEGQVSPLDKLYQDSFYLGPENVDSATGQIKNLKTCRDLDLVSGKYVFDRKSIVYSKIRPNLNKICLPNFDGVCSADMFPVWPLEEVDRYYLYSFMRSELFLRQSIPVSNRTGMPKINRDDLNKIKIIVPPYTEQRKISEILFSWDEVIIKTERLIIALRERKNGLKQLLLTGQVRFPEFGNKWESHKLGDLIKPIVRKEKIEPNKQYSLIGVKWYVAGVHIHNVISGDQIAIDSLSRIQENDILYNKMWVTKNAFGIARKEHDGAYGSSEYPQFTPKPNKVDVSFLGFFFHNAQFQHNAHRLCKGTTGRARLNPGDFLGIEVRIPEIEEQIKIAEFLQACEIEIELFSRKLEALKQQKKGLMQKLLTGQIRVKV